MIVYVEPGFGAYDEILEVEVKLTDTVSAVKQAVCEELGIRRSDELIMVFNGRELDGNSTIVECGIRERDTIGLMPETRGGFYSNT